MQFPYGIANFRTLRPRRFGKSLWLSTLENDYDLARAEDFPRLFGDLRIGPNPMPRHNQYFILKLNFSRIEARGDHEAIRQSLFDHVNRRSVVKGYRRCQRYNRRWRRRIANWARYRKAPEARYGEKLRLRTHAVVALGLERLVWREGRAPVSKKQHRQGVTQKAKIGETGAT